MMSFLVEAAKMLSRVVPVATRLTVVAVTTRLTEATVKM